MLCDFSILFEVGGFGGGGLVVDLIIFIIILISGDCGGGGLRKRSEGDDRLGTASVLLLPVQSEGA